MVIRTKTPLILAALEASDGRTGCWRCDHRVRSGILKRASGEFREARCVRGPWPAALALFPLLRSIPEDLD
jgi:hypothetical protein